MNVLVFNCGSSSQGFKVYNNLGEVIAAGKTRNLAAQTRSAAVTEWQVGERSGSSSADLAGHRQAAEMHLSILAENGVRVDAVGHRFVHGGDLFHHTAPIDTETLPKLRACLPLAPIHNPNSFAVIEACAAALPGVPQYAVFDTAFHAQMPAAARTYALPRSLAARLGFHKVGFHGLSCHYVSARMAALLGRPLAELKLIICHLGTGGASATAVQHGRTLDTSMGYSPLAGLVMSTRCGDIDPEIVLELVRQGYAVEEIEGLLNRESGLVGLSGYSSNLEEVIAAAEAGDADCRLAFEVYAHRLRMYLGAFTWLLGGADAIVFTDDVGVRSWKLREAACRGAERLGVALDEEANRRASGETRISRVGAATQVWVVPTDEERVIFEEVMISLRNSGEPG